MPAKPFVILQPSFIKDYRQEYFIINYEKEKALLRFILVGLLLLLYGLY